MKLKNTYKQIDPEIIYTNYTKLIEVNKEINEINSSEIIDETITLYKDYHTLINICTYNELEFLKDILKNKVKPTQNFMETDLSEKLLINISDNKIEIFEEFISSVKKAIRKVKVKEKIKSDSINEMIIGLTKIYGLLKIEKICDICSEKLKINHEITKNIIENSPYLHYYTYKIIYNEEQYLIYSKYFSFKKELLYFLDYYPDLEYKDFSIEDIIYNRYNLFDYRNKSIKIFIKKLEEYNINNITEFHQKIIEFSVLDKKRNEIIDYLLENIKLNKKEEQELITLLNKAMDNMPSATLKGYTPLDITKKYLEEEYDNQYQAVYQKTKENENIQDYKAIREETEILFGECIEYLMQKHALDIIKLTDICTKNNTFFNQDEANTFNNFILFHSPDKEEMLFQKYIKQLNILSQKYKIAWQIEETVTESLFEIKKFKPNEGITELKDVFNQKNYAMYDLAFSCGDKNMIGSYIYTTLITVNKFTFANGYAFVFLKESHKDIVKEIEKLKKEIKAEDEKIKTFLVCYQLFKNENVLFSAKTLE